MRIYLDINQENLVIADDNGLFVESHPTEEIKLKLNNGDTFILENASVFLKVLFNEVFDENGVSVGATVNDVANYLFSIINKKKASSVTTTTSYLVRDTVTQDIFLAEKDGNVITYYDVQGNVVTPVNPIEFFTPSGGSGGGGDASAANQQTQISLATTLNSLTEESNVLNKRSKDKTGALRVSTKTPLFTSKLTRDNRPDIWDEVLEGTATSNWSNTNASVTLTVSANNDVAIRQTKQRIPYSPGDPQLIEVTGSFNAPTANTIQRIGSFNSDGGTPYDSGLDGIYFEVDGSTIYAVIRKSGVEVAKIPQSSWNIDKLDGTGESGITLDISKVQIFVFSYLWLAVDGVNFGFKIGEEIIICHIEQFVNIDTSCYMSTPNHSIRYELRSTGGAASLQCICSAVFSENGVIPTGKNVSVHREITDGKSCLNGQHTPVIAVRLKSDNLDESYLLEAFNLLSTTRANACYVISYNPLLLQNGGSVSWDSLTEWTDVPNSGLQVCKPTGNTNYSLSDLGIQIYSGYVTDNFDSTSAFTTSQLKLGANIDTTATDYRDVLVLSVLPENNETFFASLTLKEI
jgi:hypothetical protein